MHHPKHDNHGKHCLQGCDRSINVVKTGRIRAELMITSNVDGGLEEEVVEKSLRGHREVIEESVR